jgi:hypothetical protein
MTRFCCKALFSLFGFWSFEMSDNGVYCKGCWTIGNNCGHCNRCKNALKELADRAPMDAGYVRDLLVNRGRQTASDLRIDMLRLAASHERLRAEVEGATKMIEAFGEKFHD